jgi:hypothetical protein
MTIHWTKIAADAASCILLLSLFAPDAARAQPLPRFAQPGIPGPAAIARPPLLGTRRDARSPDVEREHLKAQRIIDRVCGRC